MGVGHIAVALGASRAAPRLNVGWLVLAAFLADFMLGIFAWLGLEHASVPDGYATKHYLLFTFPYSHGLLALLLWATIFGFLISRARGVDAGRIWLIVALLVLSHFVLDGLVHVAGLPIAGENSPKFGLGLWKHLRLELLLETLMAIGGLVAYWKVAGARLSGVQRWGMGAFVMLVTAMTWTQLLVTKAPPAQQLTASWIVVPLAFAAIAYGMDWKRVRQVLPAATVPKP